MNNVLRAMLVCLTIVAFAQVASAPAQPETVILLAEENPVPLPPIPQPPPPTLA